MTLTSIPLKRWKAFLLTSMFLLSGCFEVPEKDVPGHIRAVYKSDPATSIVIGWNRYESEAQDDVFYWDTVDHGADLAAYANKKTPDHYSHYVSRLKNAFVELKGLEPETRYYFVIKNSFGVSKRFYFETLPDHRDAKISIIAGGDSRNNRTPRKAANLLVKKLKPHFVYFGGDMVAEGFPNQWFDWFEDWQITIGDDGRVTPIVPARGNHEISNDILERLFWLPESNYYVLNIADGLLRAYVLNSEAPIGGRQTDWLLEDLQNNQDAQWKIAQYHRPMRPHVAKKSEGTNQYKYWAQAFYDYGVDLVMESDAHTVKSTWPLRPSLETGSDQGFIRDDERGVVYAGEGCWGAPLRNPDDTKSWTRDSGVFNQFKWIFVDKDGIELRTVKVDNAEEVGELKADNRFAMPANLDLWNPSNGSVIYID